MTSLAERGFRAEACLVGLDGSDDVEARSYLVLYRSRGDDRPADLVSVERTDRLRPEVGGWLLVQRDLVVDEAVLRTQNLALFL
jgi:phthalate 3,4-dioxygenase beta subunit